MAVLYGSTECPTCRTVTSQAVARSGSTQWCCCRVCKAVFRAQVGADGRFTGSNVPMIGLARRATDG